MPARPSRAFAWLWGSNFGAALGDGMAAAAMPLLIAGWTRDPLVVSLHQVAAGLPWLLFGLLAGGLADRWDRRTLMWRTDVARLIIAAGLCAAIATGTFGVPAILAATFLLATSTTLLRSAAPALLPELVSRERLLQANARLQLGSTTAGSFLGPSLGALSTLSAPGCRSSVKSLRSAPQPSCFASCPEPHDA